ncbi:hypothetical protein D9M69_296840 [compost metagenome]
MAELGADVSSVGRCAAIRSDARRQQVEAPGRRRVMPDEQRLLHLGNHQHFSLRLGREHRALVVGEVLVTAPAAIEAVAQGLRLVLEAGVGGVVDVQTRHLVEADHPVHRTARQVGLDPGGEFLVALVVEQRLDRSDQDFEAFWNFTFPDHGVDTNGMPTALALQGDSHEVTLQAAEGEVLVEHECQLHQ